MADADERLRSDNRSVGDLLPLAMVEMEDDDSNKPWDALAVLQYRADSDVFKAARKLCQSDDPKERELGTVILSQNVVSQKDFPDEKFDILFELLENETDMAVLAAACHALAHIRDRRAIKPLVKLKNHPSGLVRFAVAHGMWTYKNSLAIKTLIELSTDADKDVRDWAAFGLSQMIDRDTPEIREALAARLTDDFEEARLEAIMGLALRKDSRALQPLRVEIEDSEWVSSRMLEAAMALADPGLLPGLLDLRRKGELNESLEEAIQACGGKRN